MKTKRTDIIANNKIFGYLALATTIILLIPLIAMQFNTGVNWDLTDFLIMGTLLLGTGTIFIFVARVTQKKYRTLIRICFLLTILYIWIELAVGIFTNWGS